MHDARPAHLVPEGAQFPPRPAIRRDRRALHAPRRGTWLRWDYAFWQMVVETNSLKYTGDVDANQNNFAGIGATGGGVKGEYFTNVSDGVRAHLEHIAMYAGKYINNPVADRTRKVQSWGIMDKYRRTLGGPMNYTHLGRKWAPNDRGYSNDLPGYRRRIQFPLLQRPRPAARTASPRCAARRTLRSLPIRPRSGTTSRSSSRRQFHRRYRIAQRPGSWFASRPLEFGEGRAG